jgi:hypothetical protein
MFRVILCRLLIHTVKLAVVEIRSHNDLLRSQASQGTALYFLIRNVILLYTVPPAFYGGVGWLKLGAACSSQFHTCNFYCGKCTITLRVQNRCGCLVVDGMNVCYKREICVCNFVHQNIIVCKSILKRSSASKCEWFKVRYSLFSLALQPSAGYGLLVHDISWSNTTTRHSR